MKKIYIYWGVLSIFLTSLSGISTIKNLASVKLAGIPNMIIGSYDKIKNFAFENIVEWWFPFSISDLSKDVILLYGFISATMYFYYSLIDHFDVAGEFYTIVFGPWVFLQSLLALFSPEWRSENGRYVLFAAGHLVMFIFFMLIVAVFFVWNFFAIQAL